MPEFFRSGGFGMSPVLVFGSLAVAAAVLWAIRGERRHLRLTLALALTSVGTVKSRMHGMVHRLREELLNDL